MRETAELVNLEVQRNGEEEVKRMGKAVGSDDIALEWMSRVKGSGSFDLFVLTWLFNTEFENEKELRKSRVAEKCDSKTVVRCLGSR